MSQSPDYPPSLHTQQATPSLPNAATLAEALLWDYSFTFTLPGDTELEVVFNEERRVVYALTIIDADGVGEIRVTAESGPGPLVTIQGASAVPADGGFRYQWNDGKFLTASELSDDMPTRTITVPRLRLNEVHSARAAIRQVSFAAPLLPFLAYPQTFELGPGEAPLAAHLTSFLRTILASETFVTQPVSLECHYGYTISELPVEAPVVLLPRQDITIATDAELIAQIAGSFEQWLEAVQPPRTGARLLFKVTVWNALPEQTLPLLEFGRVVLPLSIDG